jgi:hypothetical protein
MDACDSLSVGKAGFLNLGQNALAFPQVFTLRGVPGDLNGDASIDDGVDMVVTVDGKPATGWTYDSARNAVVFDANLPPAPNSEIGVFYVPSSCSKR